jgi:glycerophosphoryl diester phosphodiesterase
MRPTFIALIIFICSAAGLLVDAKPVWVAHRGASAEADENTLKSYKLALSYGVDFIECDPRPTKDGFFISMHDASVERTIGGTGKIADMTLSEIKQLRTKNGEQVPSLQEIFDLAKSAGAGVYLDTKQKDIPYLEKLIGFVLKNSMEKKVIVGLWDLKQLAWMKEHHPDIATCISWPYPSASLAHVKETGASWVGTTVPLATKSMISSAHKHGLKVITLQINDRKTINEKIALGIDAIQTDDPRLIKEK